MASDKGAKTLGWHLPASVTEAHERRNSATEQLFDIETSLSGIKPSKVSHGARTTLLQRKKGLITEIRHLKTWLRDHDTGHGTLYDADRRKKDEDLILAAYKLIVQLQKDGVDLDPPELEILVAMKARLQHAR